MALITAHFSEAELVAGLPAGTVAPPSVRAAAVSTAELLEDVRAAAGVPLRVTSWYRTEEHNREVGGVTASQHLTGNAADVVPVGLLVGDAYDRISRAIAEGRVRSFGQIIFYPTTGHIHVSTQVGTNAANRVLLAYPQPGAPTVYAYPETERVAPLPRVRTVGGMLTVAGLLVAAFLLVLLARAFFTR